MEIPNLDNIRAVDISASLVAQLITQQFPQWEDLPIWPVDPGGWDNRTFRLGEHMSVRLPSAEGYAPQVRKEHCWLPYLAAHLPLPVPTPLALGAPGCGYPWPWSVYAWLDGESALTGHVHDLAALAASLGGFLAALQRIDAAYGPPPGLHSAFRGGPLSTYDAETRQAIAALRGEIDTRGALALWKAALAAPFHGPPVWFHGDVAAGNLLILEARLSAVIDFGCAGVGDPACDLAVTWTLFSGESRNAFRAPLPLEPDCWVRGRGWALWKALITLAEHHGTDVAKAAESRRVIAQVLADQEEA